MKLGTIKLGVALFFLISIFQTLIPNGVLIAHGQEMSSKRWDLQMIEEAPIWHLLKTHYFNNPVKEYWTKRKAALQTVITPIPGKSVGG